MRIIETLLLKTQADTLFYSHNGVYTRMRTPHFRPTQLSTTINRNTLTNSYRSGCSCNQSQLLSEQPTSGAHPSNDCAPGWSVHSLHRMLMGDLMIAIRMVLCCCAVRLRCMLVVLRSLLVCVVCHKSPLCEARFVTSANLRHLWMGQGSTLCYDLAQISAGFASRPTWITRVDCPLGATPVHSTYS
jgi:hypothetical protein